jgi:hypothetical protein
MSKCTQVKITCLTLPASKLRKKGHLEALYCMGKTQEIDLAFGNNFGQFNKPQHSQIGKMLTAKCALSLAPVALSTCAGHAIHSVDIRLDILFNLSRWSPSVLSFRQVSSLEHNLLRSSVSALRQPVQQQL